MRLAFPLFLLALLVPFTVRCDDPASGRVLAITIDDLPVRLARG